MRIWRHMSESLPRPGKKAPVHAVFLSPLVYLQRAAPYPSVCSNIHTERCRESCGHLLTDVWTRGGKRVSGVVCFFA